MKQVREIVIWAHSECRSNAALFGEVKRLAESLGISVTMCLWDVVPMDETRKMHCLDYISVGDNIEKGRKVLADHGGEGTAYVFCVYQNSAVWRRLIIEAKRGGARVVVNAEAPCEMSVGAKAWLKRAYYRFVLPLKTRRVAKCADVFLNASGCDGLKRLARLGWSESKIVPFGYASWADSDGYAEHGEVISRKLHVLHTGIESEYRDVGTLKRAVDLLSERGVPLELVCTGGNVAKEELKRLYGWADVFVACGLCEPWGMRVNDAIHAGLPVVVSSGMGAKWLVEQFGCGCVFEKGNAEELAGVLGRMAKDAAFMAQLRSGVAAAHEAWTPKQRAKVFLDVVCGNESRR